jgi:hypothetical protein
VHPRPDEPLSSEQKDELAETGCVRVPQAFDAAAAAAMRDAVWRELERLHAIRRSDPSSWPSTRPTGLQGIKELPVFAPIGRGRTVGAIDALLGPGSWPRPRQWGFFLVSFPYSTEPWTVPSTGWHIDADTGIPAEPLFGLRIYSFLSDVPRAGGGTVVVLGSHRLVERHLGHHPADRGAMPRVFRRSFLRSDPGLRALTEEDPAKRAAATTFTSPHEIAGIPVRVAELTGVAGDVIVAHPWQLHARAPHCASAPRMVRSKDVYRLDLPAASRVFGRALRPGLGTRSPASDRR